MVAGGDQPHDGHMTTNDGMPTTPQPEQPADGAPTAGDPGGPTSTTTTATPPPPFAPRPPLRRSRSDRKIAGVAGGLGRHFDVDPLIIRVVLVALALFGGSGLLLYGLGWLLIPDEGQDRSEAERLLHSRGSGSSVPPLVIAVIGAIAVIGLLSYGPGRGALAVLVVVAVVMALSTRNRREAGREVGPGWTPSPPPSPEPPGWQAPYAAARAYGPEQAPGVVPPTGSTWGTTATMPAWAPPAPPTPRPPRSRLGRITLSAAALVAGLVLAGQVIADNDVHAVPVLASALAVLAAGLLVGTIWGRARWLVLPATLVALVLVAVANLPHIPPGGVGQRTYEPRSVSEIASPYQLGIGEMRLDLRDVQPVPGERVTLSVKLGIGHVRVYVDPADGLDLTATVTNGEVVVDGVSQHGRDVDVTRTDSPVTGGTVVLQIEAGIGQVEVLHETA